MLTCGGFVMMKRFLTTLSALFSAAVIAGAASLPSVPVSPTYSEASQIVGTLNALINQLNGATGYAPAQTVSLGSFCTNGTAGGTPQICNGQRGQVLFSGLTVAATGTNQAIVVTNSSVTTASSCFAQWSTAFTAGSGVYVGSVTPTAGSLSIVIANGGTTTNAVTTGTLSFNCI
jgi:hypothetical protein